MQNEKYRPGQVARNSIASKKRTPEKEKTGIEIEMIKYCQYGPNHF